MSYTYWLYEEGLGTVRPDEELLKREPWIAILEIKITTFMENNKSRICWSKTSEMKFKPTQDQVVVLMTGFILFHKIQTVHFLN